MPNRQNMEILPTEGPHPVVYAEWLSAPRAANGTAAPTVLIYGHYDGKSGVSPPGPLRRRLVGCSLLGLSKSGGKERPRLPYSQTPPHVMLQAPYPV